MRIKEPLAVFKFAICVLLAVLCRNGYAQEEFPLNELTFTGPSAARTGDHFEYFLLKHGFFRGVRSDEEESTIIAEWKRQHPKATVIPVSIQGEKSRFPLVHFWAVDGEDNLNLYLVRKGIYPALVMLDTPQFKQLVQLSRNTPYGEMLAAQERAGNPKGVESRRLVSEPRYNVFLKQLVAAETAAKAESQGIWSAGLKRERDKLGFIPLSAMLPSFHTDAE
jgi:hypothetical protein